MSPLEAAELSLEHPPNLAYFGDLHEQDDRECVCRSSIEKLYSTVALDQLDRGLGRLVGEMQPIIRYSLDESNGERVDEEAREHVNAFRERHPAIVAWAGEHYASGARDLEWRLAESVVERLGDAYDEHCGECGEVLA